jgi:hypothetical protein
MVRSSLAPENHGSAAFRARFLTEQKQDRRGVLDRAPETKPQTQIDAARVHP